MRSAASRQRVSSSFSTSSRRLIHHLALYSGAALSSVSVVDVLAISSRWGRVCSQVPDIFQGKAVVYTSSGIRCKSFIGACALLLFTLRIHDDGGVPESIRIMA